VVRKFLIFIGLWMALSVSGFASETMTLVDGSTMSGEIVKFDDHDAMIHLASDDYTNIVWPRFSQDTLKQFAANPKYRAAAEPFITPAPLQPPSIAVNPVTRLTVPERPSVFGGLFGSSLGLFILLVIYGANLYAAYEVAVVRGRPVAMVVAVSAVLPIAGPAIFLAIPVEVVSQEEGRPEEVLPEGGAPAAGAPAPAPGAEDIQIVSASWQGSQEEKKPEPQIFSRGKFTFNKRFIETKFAGFIGEPKGDAKSFSMSMKTLKDKINVECIKQIGAAECILETPTGQLTVALTDIQEIILTPKTA
jgi:hypothetical protein